MKRYSGLFKKIYDMDNLRLAHKNAKRGKGWYEEVIEIEKNPDKYLQIIQNRFLTHTYHTSEYEIFRKREGQKDRTIYKLPYFPDRIAQWAILQVIEPYLIRNMIDDTYSAIPGRGIHKGLFKVQNCMKYHEEECRYCLKIDARHYYQSINHRILKEKYRTLFKDEDLLYLLDEIIDSTNTIDLDDIREIEVAGMDYDPETGIPIGNYLSQYSGNFYFSAFDHWMKEEQHTKYYFRYMDDIVIFGESKEKLHMLLNEINDYFRENLNLRIKPNYQIFPSYVRGIDFLGYRVFKNYTLLRKSTCDDMKQKFLQVKAKGDSGKLLNYHEYCMCNSYYGWLKYCNCFRLEQKYYAPVKPYLDNYYNTVIKKKGHKSHEESGKNKVNYKTGNRRCA